MEVGFIRATLIQGVRYAMSQPCKCMIRFTHIGKNKRYDNGSEHILHHPST
jgi:hypothetical protein